MRHALIPLIGVRVGNDRGAIPGFVQRRIECALQLGSIVPFGDADALQRALVAALDKTWDRAGIIAYAHANQWDKRVAQLLRAYDGILGPSMMPAERVVA